MLRDPSPSARFPGAATLLRWGAGVQVRLGPEGRVTVRGPGGELTSNQRLLELLGAFGRPAPLGTVLPELASRHPSEFAELAATARHLVRIGALVSDEHPGDGAVHDGFGEAGIHLRMLSDHTRTRAFMDALAATVRPGDVVLDLGTGTGILAAHAARLGARRVYAVEASDAARAAQAFLRDNGLQDRVEVRHGWSQHLDLPEPADVVVSETLGNHPLEEGWAAAMQDARRRLAAPGARFVPAALEAVAVPVALPPSERLRRVAHEALDRWHELYGFDFSAVAAWQELGPARLGNSRSARVAGWDTPTGPVDLARWEAGATPGLEGLVDLAVRQECRPDAVALAFRAHLAPGSVLSTVPGEAAADSHWGVALYRLDTPGDPLRPGEPARLRWCLEPAGTRFRLER